MADFERSLKSMLERKAETVTTSQALPFNTLKRARIRQASVVVASTLAMVAIAGVSVLAARNLPESQRDVPPAGPGVDEGERPRCSASTMTPAGPQEGLPPEVQEMRAAILEAAIECDFDRLEALGAPGDFGFSLAFEVDDEGNVTQVAKDASDYWEQLERRRELGGDRAKRYLWDPMARLVATLNTNHGRWRPEVGPSRGSSFYVWPRAAVDDSPGMTEEDWDVLRQVYSEREIRSYRRYERLGGPYFGYRIQISASGDWTIFTAGD